MHTCVVECRQEAEQNPRVDDALSEIGGKHEHKVFPAGIVKSEKHDEQIT